MLIIFQMLEDLPNGDSQAAETGRNHRPVRLRLWVAHQVSFFSNILLQNLHFPDFQI